MARGFREPDGPPLAASVWKVVLEAFPNSLVVVDGTGDIVYCNPYAEVVLGMRGEDVAGRRFGDVFCPSVPPGRCWLDDALRSGQVRRRIRFDMEYQNGCSYCLEADFTPLGSHGCEGAIVAVREAQDRVPATTEAPAAGPSEVCARDATVDGLYTVDDRWRLTSFNPAVERMTGLREADVLGHLCSEVLQTDHCRRDCPLAMALERGEVCFGRRLVLYPKTARSVPATANTAVLYSRDGHPLGGVVSLRNDRVLKRLREDLEPITQFAGMVGEHESMRELYELIDQVADAEANVLILGAIGTGAEAVVDALVGRSCRRDRPCVKVNCSAFPDSLLEGELFGGANGATADGRRDRVGCFQRADGGTLFLDGVAKISPAVQLKLLRVLEDGKVQPTGSADAVEVDVRVIAATDRDLLPLVEEESFRDDLHYRLNVIPVILPSLSKRWSDIPLLVDYYLTKFRLLTGKAVLEISDTALDLLMCYDFPGDVRELEDAVENAFARTADTVISEGQLPLAIRPAAGRRRGRHGSEDERQRIVEALQRTHWNRGQTAQALGISRTTLWRRMHVLDISDRTEPE